VTGVGNYLLDSLKFLCSGFMSLSKNKNKVPSGKNKVN
jgi:hypothetical protein